MRAIATKSEFESKPAIPQTTPNAINLEIRCIANLYVAWMAAKADADYFALDARSALYARSFRLRWHANQAGMAQTFLKFS